MVEGPVQGAVSASAVQLHEAATVVLDEDAAAELMLGTVKVSGALCSLSGMWWRNHGPVEGTSSDVCSPRGPWLTLR